MASQSLFRSSVSFALKNMKKFFLKLLATIIIAMFIVGIGMTVLAASGIMLYQLFFTETLSSLVGVEMATKFINSAARPVILIFASVLFLILALYILHCIVKAFLRCLSVFLSVARGEKDVQKSNRRTVLQAVILLIISVMISSLFQLVVKHTISVPEYRWLGHLLVYFVMTRFQYSWFILIEKSVSGCRAVVLSWKLTSGNLVEICKIMITYNLFSIIMMIVPLYQYQLHWSVWLMLMTLNMIIYLPFAMLVFARSYVLLDEK